MDQTLPRPASVIVVDDDAAVCSALSFALQAEGFAVETRASAEELLAGPLPIRHACLVIDERLPGLGGLAALEMLRRRHVDLPAVLITSNPTKALIAQARTAGVPIVEKPLLSDTLVDVIRMALVA